MTFTVRHAFNPAANFVHKTAHLRSGRAPRPRRVDASICSHKRANAGLLETPDAIGLGPRRVANVRRGVFSRRSDVGRQAIAVVRQRISGARGIDRSDRESICAERDCRDVAEGVAGFSWRPPPVDRKSGNVSTGICDTSVYRVRSRRGDGRAGASVGNAAFLPWDESIDWRRRHDPTARLNDVDRWRSDRRKFGGLGVVAQGRRVAASIRDRLKT